MWRRGRQSFRPRPGEEVEERGRWWLPIPAGPTQKPDPERANDGQEGAKLSRSVGLQSGGENSLKRLPSEKGRKGGSGKDPLSWWRRGEEAINGRGSGRGMVCVVVVAGDCS